MKDSGGNRLRRPWRARIPSRRETVATNGFPFSKNDYGYGGRESFRAGRRWRQRISVFQEVITVMEGANPFAPGDRGGKGLPPSKSDYGYGGRESFRAE